MVRFERKFWLRRAGRMAGCAMTAALLTTGAGWGSAAAPAALGLQTQKAEKDGITLELEVEPIQGEVLRESEHARIRLKVTDTHTGSPVSGIYPGGWIDRLAKAEGGKGVLHDDYKTCKQKVEAFLGGSILSRPEVDLNVYYVVTLNEDNTLSIVDPLFGFGNSKLLAMVFLESVGRDWVLSAGGDRLFVSMPAVDKIAVVDTETWKVIANLPTGSQPVRVLLQPDGAYLWVGFEGSGKDAPSGVSVFDARDLKPVGEVLTGKGGHDLAASHDSRYVFVTNEAEASVAVVEVATLKVARKLATGSRPVSVAWSKLAAAAYVVATGDGSVTVVDPASDQPRARAMANPGSGQIRFAPGHRLGFIVNTSKNEVHVLDAALNQIVQTADVEEEPDQVTFSGELAYIRHKGSDTVLMIPWKEVGQRGKQIPAVDFTGGQTPPGKMAEGSPADGIVQAPGAAAVLVANYLDQTIYYYKEGMAAPMGSFRNYGKSPRALVVIDRTLREVKPGVYETNAKLTGDGAYDVAFFLDSPRMVQCFPIQVAENARLAAARKPKIRVATEGNPDKVRAGTDVAVRVRLTEAESGAPLVGLKDVRFLTFRSPGLWQMRQWATEVGAGVYEIHYTPPEEGLYFVFVEVPSKGLPFQGSPYLSMIAEEAPAAGAPAEAAQLPPVASTDPSVTGAAAPRGGR